MLLPTCAQNSSGIFCSTLCAAVKESVKTQTQQTCGTTLCNYEPISDRNHISSTNQRAAGAGQITVSHYRVKGVKPINRYAVEQRLSRLMSKSLSLTSNSLILSICSKAPTTVYCCCTEATLGCKQNRFKS